MNAFVINSFRYSPIRKFENGYSRSQMPARCNTFSRWRPLWRSRLCHPTRSARRMAWSYRQLRMQLRKSSESSHVSGLLKCVIISERQRLLVSRVEEQVTRLAPTNVQHVRSIAENAAKLVTLLVTVFLVVVSTFISMAAATIVIVAVHDHRSFAQERAS